MDRFRNSYPVDVTRVACSAVRAAFLAVVLTPFSGPFAFAQVAGCESTTLRMASTRDFKSSPQGRSLIFETLTALDDRGAPIPHLATSWKISDDEREYVFDLRPDVTFSSGTAFSAEAAVHSVRLAAETAGFGRHFERVEMLGPHQIRIRLTRPYWPLLNELSFEHVSKIVEPLTPEADESEGSGSARYRGTGPFVLVEYEPDAGAELIPNADYWGVKPRIDRLEWKTMQDPTEQIVALRAGQVDVIGAAEHHGALSYRAFGELLDDPRFETRFRSYGRHQVLDFNVSHPILAELEVRQAIDAGIDREHLVDELMGAIPSAEYTLSPPRPAWQLGPSLAGRSRYDPARSRELLTSAGWVRSESRGVRYRNGNPLELRLLVNEHESNAVAAAHYVTKALGQIGFQVKLESVPGALVSERLKSGDFDVHVSHSCSAAQLGCLSARGKYTRFNETIGLYSTPELEQLIEDALGPAATAHQETAFDALWQALSENVVGAPLFDVVKPMAHRSDVKGIEYGSTVLAIDLSQARIEAASNEPCTK